MDGVDGRMVESRVAFRKFVGSSVPMPITMKPPVHSQSPKSINTNTNQINTNNNLQNQCLHSHLPPMIYTKTMILWYIVKPTCSPQYIPHSIYILWGTCAYTVTPCSPNYILPTVYNRKGCSTQYIPTVYNVLPTVYNMLPTVYPHSIFYPFPHGI